MAKLTKGELARRKISDVVYVDESTRLGDLVERFGADAHFQVDYGYYDEADRYYLSSYREETDEEYQKRIDDILVMKVAEEERRKAEKSKREDADRKTYERLRKKFEKN